MAVGSSRFFVEILLGKACDSALMPSFIQGPLTWSYKVCILPASLDQALIAGWQAQILARQGLIILLSSLDIKFV